MNAGTTIFEITERARAKRPTKVEYVLRRIERSREWSGLPVEVEDRDGLWIIRVTRDPDHWLLTQTLTVYIAARTAYTIPGTDIRMRSSQRLQGGSVRGVLRSDRELKTWRDVELATFPRDF